MTGDEGRCLSNLEYAVGVVARRYLIEAGRKMLARKGVTVGGGSAAMTDSSGPRWMERSGEMLIDVAKPAEIPDAAVVATIAGLFDTVATGRRRFVSVDVAVGVVDSIARCDRADRDRTKMMT